MKKSRKKTHIVNPMVGGNAVQWWLTCLAHKLLMQQPYLQEALLLGCGLFHFMLEMFKPRGGRQLGHRPGVALTYQLLSPHQLNNPALPFS